MVQRGPKLAIAAGILASGIGTAFVFRKDASDQPVDLQKTGEELVLRHEVNPSKAVFSAEDAGPLWQGTIDVPRTIGNLEDALGENLSDLAEKTKAEAAPIVDQLKSAAQQAEKQLSQNSDLKANLDEAKQTAIAKAQELEQKLAAPPTPPPLPDSYKEAFAKPVPPAEVAAEPTTIEREIAKAPPPETKLAVAEPIRLVPVAPYQAQTSVASQPQSHEAGYAPTTVATSPARNHRVVDGDTLPGLAERYLGSAHRAGEILAANATKLTSSELLPIGADLVIPSGPPKETPILRAPAEHATPVISAPRPNQPPLVPVQPAAQPSIPAAPKNLIQNTTTVAPTAQQQFWLPQQVKFQKRDNSYQTLPGETLTEVSRKVYGDARYHELIFNANRDQLSHPDGLLPGMTLRIP